MFSVKASTFLAFSQVAIRPGPPSHLISFPSSRHHMRGNRLFASPVFLRLLPGLRKMNPFLASLNHTFAFHAAVRSCNP